LEFSKREIPYLPDKRLDVFYKGEKLNKFYIADFVCYGEIIIEIKAMDGIVDNIWHKFLIILKQLGFD
jgi:GxxExxY protein